MPAYKTKTGSWIINTMVRPAMRWKIICFLWIGGCNWSKREVVGREVEFPCQMTVMPAKAWFAGLYWQGQSWQLSLTSMTQKVCTCQTGSGWGREGQSLLLAKQSRAAALPLTDWDQRGLWSSLEGRETFQISQGEVAPGRSVYHFLTPGT